MPNYEKSLIVKIIDFLDGRPGLRYTSRENYIHIYPSAKNGFPISAACLADGRYMVMFHFWFDIFTHEDEVIRMVRFGLSDTCRLRVNKKGRRIFNGRPSIVKGEDGLI